MASIFSKIVAGEIPCYKIAETENCLAFLDVFPLVHGHVLVIPKKEIDYIFDLDDRGWVGNAKGDAALAAERDNKIKVARDRLKVDAYQLTMIHKLKDPGAILTLVGQVKDLGGMCKVPCDTIKLTFDPAVGTDTWYIEVNSETKMPEVIERQEGTGRVGFSLADWTTVAGGKLPTRMQNLGMASEVFQIEGIEIGDPDESLYVVPVR